jgi:transcriptional regulator with XRE-family HTH domain
MDFSSASSMESLSTRLVLERERRNISLEEISLSTKINIRFLTAIEQGHFEELPGGIISKGFLRAYARQIGMDEEQAIAGYQEAIRANQTEAVFEPASFQASVKNQASVAARLPWWAFAVALLIIGFGFIALRHYKRGLMHRDERGSASCVRPIAPVNKQPPSPNAASALQFFANYEEFGLLPRIMPAAYV